MLKELDKKALVKYFRSLGLEVNTSTKARGHQGFFVNNRNKHITPTFYVVDYSFTSKTTIFVFASDIISGE